MSQWRKTLLLSCAATLTTVAPPSVETAWAQGNTTLRDLQRQLLLIQSQIDELKAEASEEDDGDDIDLKVKWKGAPELSSADGRWKMKMRGRIMADYGNINGDDIASSQGPAGAVDYDESETEFRRARLGIEGQIMGNTKYKFEVDFGDGGGAIDVTDAYLQWKNVFENADITVGQFKTPNSLEEQTSSRYITFMERAQFTDAFGLSRQGGIGIGTGGDNWTVNVGAFGSNLDNGNDELKESLTLAGRVTFAPMLEDDVFIHVGGSFRYRDISEEEETVRYRQRPHAHISNVRYVSTGKIDADKDLFYGGEFATGWGPLAVQAEYARSKVNRPGDGMSDDPSFSGWYVDASYFLTGEKRNYEADDGQFKRVKVINPVNDGGWGAWQIAVRYDALNLNDEDAGVMGGEQSYFIAGINWHLNNYTRLMFNYARVDVDAPVDVDELDEGFPGVSAIIGGTPADNKIDTVTLRAQIDW